MWSLAADVQAGMRQKSGNPIKDQENIWKASEYYLDRKMLWPFSTHYLFILWICVYWGCVSWLEGRDQVRVCESVLSSHSVDPRDRSQFLKLGCKCLYQLRFCVRPFWIFGDIVIIRIMLWLSHSLMFLNVISPSVKKFAILGFFSFIYLFSESLVYLST